MYQSVPSVEFNTYWIPCTWFINLLKETKRGSRITDSHGLQIIMQVFYLYFNAVKYPQSLTHFHGAVSSLKSGYLCTSSFSSSLSRFQFLGSTVTKKSPSVPVFPFPVLFHLRPFLPPLFYISHYLVHPPGSWPYVLDHEISGSFITMITKACHRTLS
jgi:hypothetical protein